MVIIENRIKELLAISKKQNADLADFLGISVGMVSKYCRNVNQPRVESLPKIAAFFQIENPLEILKVIRKKD